MSPRDHFRAHSRRRVDLQAVVRDRAGATAHGARIKNLGLGGACLELPAGPPRGFLELEASVTLEVTAPTLWDPLSLRGRVAWIQTSGAGGLTRAGVRFEHRDAGSLYALFQLLGAHAYDA
jgi:hypothetical protein